MKVGYNSNGYQMVEQRISCKGPDNINVSSAGKTDHSYTLIQKYEALLYANQTDIKILIQRLIEDEHFPNDYAEGI